MKRKISHGFTLLEATVTVGLVVVLVISAYNLYSSITWSGFQTASRMTALSRARIIEDQMQDLLQNAGLGTVEGAAAITEARQDRLALQSNRGYYSYSTTAVFIPQATPAAVAVHRAGALEAGTPLIILSPTGRLISDSPVLQEYNEESETITITNSQPVWIEQGSYIGQPAASQTLTLNNGKLLLTIDGAQNMLADSVEAFDLAFLYDPPWIDQNSNGIVDDGEDLTPLWCYDAAEDYPDDYDPNGLQRILDTNLSGEIDEDDDLDDDLLIEGATLPDLIDTDGNEKLNGVLFERASIARVWILVTTEKMFGATGSARYVVGRRIFTFNDGRERVVGFIDVPLRN